MQSFSDKLPAHETVYRALRDKVLFGDLAPEQAVTIQGLVDELQVSMTPVREAIRRLTAEGALELKGNRRISVPMMGPRRFEELVFARSTIEPKLAEIAAQNMGDVEIAHLKSIDACVDEAIRAGDIHGYMRANYRFHFALYRQANSRVLMPIAKSLWLRYGPLSRIICGRFGTSNLEDCHEQAIEALIARKPKAVAEAIQMDIQQGFEIVQASFSEPVI